MHMIPGVPFTFVFGFPYDTADVGIVSVRSPGKPEEPILIV